MAAHERLLSAPIAVVAAGAGDNQLVAAPGAGKKIRVVGFAFVVSAAGVNPKFKSGAATDLTGPMTLAANGGIAPPQADPDFNNRLGGGHFECNVNEALNLNVAGAGNVGGWVNYQIIG